MKKVGKQSVSFDEVYLKTCATACGPLEAQGPLGQFFDRSYNDCYCNGLTWEQGEMNLLKDAIDIALQKGAMSISDIDLAVGGDLNNQIAVTNYVLRDYDVPLLGIYAACSTCTEGLITSSMLVDGGFGKNILCSASSHNATSERQFRYPTEYGGQKPESMTFTATGAGVGIVSSQASPIRITRATIGKIVDPQLKDPQDMGRTMAPAAAMTLKTHLEDFNLTVEDYDLIITGDLSLYGATIFREILKEFKIDLGKRYNDSGMMLYDREKQDVFAGGSGCGCVSLVTYGYLVDCLKRGQYNKILIIATGALMNPIMVAQKESIPSIAHAVALERGFA